jgi:hypoxanthine-DNA glycosylase
MLTGLAPLASPRTRLLILGSFPGVASLAAQRYYGHPQNHFWRILSAIWPSSPIKMGASSYENNSKIILEKGLGLWDVYAACEREGSLDSRIREVELNDLAGLIARCPALEAIAHNGGESYKHARITGAFGFPVYRLPSTSPANASWSFDRKLAAWRAVFEKHGLV